MIETQYLLKIFEACPLPSLLLLADPPSFTISGVNNAWLTITATSKESLTGNPVFDQFPVSPGEMPALAGSDLRHSLCAVIDTGLPEIMSTRQYRLPAYEPGTFTIKYLEVENVPITDDAGNVELIMLSAKDVTEKILLERSYQELKTENMFATALKGSPIPLDNATVIERFDSNQEALINSTDDMIWSLNHEYRYIAGNRAFIRIFESGTGVTLKPGDDMMIRDVFPEEFLTAWKALFDRGLAGESYKEEIFFPAFNNSREAWSEINFSPIYREGLVVALTCSSRTITERKLAEEQLKQSQARLAEAQRVAKMGSWNFDLLTGKVEWSEQLYNIFGTDSNSFPGTHQSFISLLNNEDRPRVLLTHQFAQETGEPFMIEYNITTPVAEQRVIREYGHSEPDASGKIIRLFGTARDVTELKKGEEDNRFKVKLLNTIGQAVIATDTKGFVRFWNNAAKEIYGWKEDEAIGKNVVDLIPSAETKQRGFEIMHQLLQGHTWSGEFMVQRKGGEIFPAFVTDAPIYDEHNKLSGIIGVSTDITERKRTEHQLIMNEEQLAVIYNTVTDIIFMLSVEEDGRFRFTSTNHSFLETSGLSSGEVIGQYVENVLPSSSLDSAIRNYKQAVATKRSVQWEETSHYLTGARTGLACVTPVLDDEGMCVRLVGSIHDITEKYRAREKLKSSEEKYRILFMSSPLPKWIYDLKTYRILDVNDAALTHYGYSRVEFLEMTIYDIRPTEQVQGLIDFHEVFKHTTGPMFFGVFIHQKKDHTRIQVEVSGNLFYYEERDCMLIECVDVTEREKALNELVDREAKLEQAQRIAKLGYWQSNVDRQTLYWSDEVYNIWGVSKHSFTASYKAFVETIHPDDKYVFAREQVAFFSGEKEYDIEHRIILPDGSIKWVQEKGKLIRDDEGRPVIFAGTVQDITRQKLLALSLEESNQRFKYVTSATFDAIWDWDLVAQTLLWGEGFQTIFGYNLQELSPGISSWTDHIHPADKARVIKGIYEFIDGNQTHWVDEFRYLKKDKTYAYVTDKGLVIRNDEGKATRMVGAMQDITEKKILEDLLGKAGSLARFGSWEVNVLKNTVYFSDITKEIHEVGPDFSPDIQNALTFYKKGDSRELITRKLRESIKNGSPWDIETQIITAKGNEKWIRSIGEAEFANGKCVRVWGSFQDIDARKKAELALSEALEEKNTILESIGDAFFTIDRSWNVTYWNNQAVRLLGIPKEEIVGQPLWDVLRDRINDNSYQKYKEAFDTKEVIHFEDYYELLSKWFEVSIYPSYTGLTVYFKDITQRKLSEIRLTELNDDIRKHAKELAISNAELEQFAYVASHDLQEPLRMVTGFLTQLETRYGNDLDERGKRYIHFAVDGAKRMRQIILDLLEFSRIGRIDDQPEDLDLNELFNEIEILFSKQIEEKKAVIIHDNLPRIRAHKAPMRQVFQNLVSNALKYTRQNVPARIEVTAMESATNWQFAIADNGIGIEEEYFNKIFIIFQRLHNKDEFSGTGMGLAVTKKIVDSLGGKIWVESREGTGSTFFFTLLKQQ